jgi:hypothetical protein
MRELICDYTTLNEKQIDLLEKTVKDKSIVDLGCGQLDFIHYCVIKLGAKDAIGVDIQKPKYQGSLPDNVSFVESSFGDYQYTKGDVAILAWPSVFISLPVPNTETISDDLIRILKNFETVIYIGLNDGKTAVCGNPKLWEYLTQRELIAHELGNNNMLVYGGDDFDVERLLIQEEYNGLRAYETCD